MTRPNLLITRAPNSFDWAAEGFNVLHAPLLDIQQVDQSKEMVMQMLTAPPQAIIMTSAQATYALPARCRVPLAIVGAATAAQAVAQGHLPGIVAQGNVDSLIHAITTQLAPEKGRLVYLRGDHVSTDLAGKLRGSGFDVEEIITYRAEPISRLPDTVLTALATGQVQAVTAYSARSLTTLEQLMIQHGLDDVARILPLVCFSEAIARRASARMWQKTIHAKVATDTEMLRIFKHLFEMPAHITTKT